jgi:hypothetical protein
MPMTALTYSRYLDSAEEADSREALEFDDEQYPQLPENVGNLRLPVDPVVIINNTTVIATLAYLTICCNCNGHN